MAKVAILGSGNAGCTYAAYLGKRGHDVRLYDSKSFESNLSAIKENGGMNITGLETGFGPINTVTTDIEKALYGVDIIMIVVPGFGHKPLAEQLAPHLKDGQIIVLNPGAVFGGFEVLNTIRSLGCKADITIGELASNIFACRRVGPITVNITGIKDTIEISTIPSSRVNETISRLNVFFPDTYVSVPNEIYTSFGYNNLIIHPAGALLNMGRIEWFNGKYDFYWEGLTPGVCKNIEAVDRERLAVAEAMGCHLESFMEITHRYYGHPERETVYDFYRQSDVHGGTGTPTAPTDLKGRYITEDIPYALVPLEGIAKKCNINTPTISALITVASNANEEDYRVTGRSLSALGLADYTKEEIIRLINDGF